MRSDAQIKAEKKHNEARRGKPRFGGYCTDEEKSKLSTLAKLKGVSEKELIFQLVSKEYSLCK